MRTTDTYSVQSVQLLSRVWLFVTPWTAGCQASLSITNSRSLLKLMSIESVMPTNHLILCHSLLLLPSILPSIRVFSSELALGIRRAKYWSKSNTLINLISIYLVLSQYQRLCNALGYRIIKFAYLVQMKHLWRD